MKEYNIVFSGLKTGMHHFEYQLSESFFKLFEFEEIQAPEFVVQVDFEKLNTMINLNFELSGSYKAICDISGKEFDQNVFGEFELVVKFGEEYNDENDEVLILPHGAYEVNIAQYLYELAVLAIPQKTIHPDIEKGKMDDETKELLEKYSAGSHEENEETTDPRWEKLKELKNKN